MSKIVFISGANSGLGYETAKVLVTSDSSYHVIIGSRSEENGNKAVESLTSEIKNANGSSQVDYIKLDITDDSSIQKAFQDLKSKVNHIDAFVNNAGAQFDSQYASGKMSQRETWNSNYNTNITSTFIVTEVFMFLILASSDPRLVFVSSGTSSQDEASRGLPVQAGKPPAGWPKPPAFSFTSYRCSKTAINMAMLEWKRTLGNDNIKIFGLDPRFLATGLGGVGPEKLKQMGALDPTVGANFIKSVIDGERDADHGKVVRKNGILPW